MVEQTSDVVDWKTWNYLLLYLRNGGRSFVIRL